MKAHNLTVSVPPDEVLCDKNCPYCISRMTGQIEHDYFTVMRNLSKVVTVSKASGVSTVLITGKGEPLLNFYGTARIAQKLKDFPIEIQTNGLWLNDRLESIKELKGVGIDTIAVSVDSLSQLSDLGTLFERINEENMTVRVCFNVISPQYLSTVRAENVSFATINKCLKFHPIHQVVLRRIMIPDIIAGTKEAHKTSDWVLKNVNKDFYDELNKEFMATLERNRYSSSLIRVLPHGAKVYNLDGRSFCFSDYCIQETNNTEDIRSLIFLEDGHLYTSWDKVPASRLF